MVTEQTAAAAAGCFENFVRPEITGKSLQAVPGEVCWESHWNGKLPPEFIWRQLMMKTRKYEDLATLGFVVINE